MTRVWKWAAPSLAIAGLALAAGCAGRSGSEFPHAIMTPAATPTLPPVALRAAGGELKPADLAGRWVWLYFGYANCPDVCPTALAEVAQAYKRLKRPERVVPVFVSVDPARDTPQTLKAFAAFYHPAIRAVTGPRAAIDAWAQAVGAAYVLDKPARPGGAYDVSHSNLIFVLDPAGRYVATYVPGSGVDGLVGDFDAQTAP